MSAHQAAAASQTKAPTTPTQPKDRKAMGGYFGADATANSTVLGPANSRRATFLGA